MTNRPHLADQTDGRLSRALGCARCGLCCGERQEDRESRCASSRHSGLIELIVFGLVLFSLAGTLDFWQAWAFLVGVRPVDVDPQHLSCNATDPEAHQRRKHAGPAAETRMVQKVLIAGWYLSLARDGRGQRPGPSLRLVVGTGGDLRVPVTCWWPVGLGVTSLVVIQNSFAASTVQVESGQKLGLHRPVRAGASSDVHRQRADDHRLPAGARLLLGLLPVIPGLIVLDRPHSG